MMGKNWLIVGAVFVFFGGVNLELVNAQENYMPLVSNGVIPEDFIKATADKYRDQVEEIEQTKIKRSDRKYQKDFALGSNFGVDAILLNGMVLYNDSISLYVQSIAKEILKEDIGLYKELRFYTLKDASANAFTTDNGIIFVTTGLLARLKSEAQLAFILCHEMSHYILKHGKNNYVKRQKLINGEIRGGLSMLEKVHTLFGFSKQAEYQADEKGLELFLKTKYNKEAAISSFEILKKSDEPLGEHTFDFKSLESTYYIFPEKLFIETLKEKKEEDDDSFHTHPSATKRQFVIEDILEDENLAGQDFILSETRFYEIQYIAQMEMLLTQVNFGEYVEALHNSNYLKTIYPSNNFVRNIHSYCLYSLTKASLDNDKSDYVLKDDFGNLSETNYFIKKLKDEEIAVLAARDIYFNYKLDTSNVFALELFKNQIKDLMKEELMYLSFKLDTPVNSREQYFKDSISIEEKYGDKLTASQKKRKLKRLARKQEKKYYLYGFFDLIGSDSEFKRIFKETEREYKKEVVEEENRTVRTIDLSDRIYMQKGYSAGIDTLILMEPGLRRISYTGRGGKENKLKDNQLEQNLVESMETNAALLNLECSILKERGQDGLTTESYNVRNLLISVLMDRASTSFREQIIFNDQFKSSIYDEYGTYNLGLLNVTNVKFPGEVRAEEVLLIFLYGIGVPLVINSALPKNYLYMNFVIINLDSGKIPFAVKYNFRGKFKRHKVDAHIYHLLNQLKSK